MKRITVIAFLLAGFSICLSAQIFQEQFNSLADKKDTAAQRQLLIQWKLSKPGDPELYVAFFNYYYRKSASEVVRMDKNPTGDAVLKIMDKDTTKKQPVAYLHDDIEYKSGALKIAFAYIDTGILKFPKRLDMRFGKIYVFGETKDYSNFTSEIIKTIDYSAGINNKWTWTNNEPVKNDPKKFMLGGVHDYLVQLYNTGDDKLMDNMKRISESVLKYYPDNVEILSDLAICYMVNRDFAGALKPLLKAEKISPKDFIVLNNIANCYKELKDISNAIKYYKLTAKYGDAEAKEVSKKMLEELRTK
jgi:tetratricopeptide (TPR) repeat protein